MYKDHELRVINEKDKLDANIYELLDFINNNPTFDKLPLEDRDLLIEQSSAMSQYYDILCKRIARFEV